MNNNNFLMKNLTYTNAFHGHSSFTMEREIKGLADNEITYHFHDSNDKVNFIISTSGNNLHGPEFIHCRINNQI